MSDILLLGYYGFGNSGDDALLSSVIKQLKNKKDDIKLKILSNDPKGTAELYKTDAVGRYNIFSVLYEMKRTKMLVLGGGTLIQDATSTKSLLYYLFIIKLALLFNKKVMLYGNGIGPLQEKNHKRVRKILNRVDVITLRDPMSAEELEKIGVTKPVIKLCADPVFSIDTDLSESENSKTDYVFVSLRNYKSADEKTLKAIAETMDYIKEKYACTSRLVPFQKDRDTDVLNALKKYCKPTSAYIDTADYSTQELLDIIKNAKICIGMRLHSLIYSSIAQTPCIGLSYDPKVTGFMKYTGQKRFIDIEKTEADTLIKMIDECFENSDAIRQDMKKSYIAMKELSQQNADIAIGLLERK